MGKERTIDVGKKIRYDRIVNPGTGKTVMIPLDHGVTWAPWQASTGDPRTFEKLVAVCPVPVVVAGGPRKGTTRDMLEMVGEAMDCGAAGVALGRNVWQSSDPARTTRALADIIHRGKTPDKLEGGLD